MADKYDNRKPRVDLVPPHALLAVADVMTYGAKKYAAWNFLEGEGLEFSRLTAAALRHLIAFNCGQDTDRESGLPHLAHAACCLMMLYETQQVHPERDDRFRPSNSCPKAEKAVRSKREAVRSKQRKIMSADCAFLSEEEEAQLKRYVESVRGEKQ